MHRVTLLEAEVRSLREANSSLAKRRKTKKKRIRNRGALAIGEAQDILDQKDADTQLKEETRASSSRVRRTQPRGQRCGTCGETGHNARTCQMEKGVFKESEPISLN